MFYDGNKADPSSASIDVPGHNLGTSHSCSKGTPKNMKVWWAVPTLHFLALQLSEQVIKHGKPGNKGSFRSPPAKAADSTGVTLVPLEKEGMSELVKMKKKGEHPTRRLAGGWLVKIIEPRLYF